MDTQDRYKNTSTVSQVNNYKEMEVWLNRFEESKNGPKQSEKCITKANCPKHLKWINRRSVRLSHLTGSMGIQNHNYNELCQHCKRSVYEWFHDEAWKDVKDYPRVSEAVFSAKIEENALANITTNSYQKYAEMLDDFHNNKYTSISKDELESQRHHYQNSENQWNNALLRLKEAIAYDEHVRREIRK